MANSPDLNDPHVNPSADHLSVYASPEAVAAAAANELAIKAVVSPESLVADTPKATVRELQEEFFDVVGVEADVVEPADSAPVVEDTPVEDTPPSSGEEF